MKNPVAKYMNKFNKASTHTDKKKQSKLEPTIDDDINLKMDQFIEMKKAFDAADVPRGERCIKVAEEDVDLIIKAYNIEAGKDRKIALAKEGFKVDGKLYAYLVEEDDGQTTDTRERTK